MAKTFEKGKIFNLKTMIEYAEGGVISKQILKNPAGNITLFSFDKEEGLSEHTTPFDALVEVLDGKVEITIGDEKMIVAEGESVILPAKIPHALLAIEKFKMLLTMIKG
ncbi:MAG: cupin domain-containing protein [Flavobacteriaceae bacterium]|nr:cupin domain-containing protein [Flavobacteriaceae bacterium]